MGWMEEARSGAAWVQEPFNALGRAKYMNNFAEGGVASHMFPSEGIKVRRGLFGMKVRPGSSAYMKNLQAVIDKGQAMGAGGSMTKEVEAATKLQKMHAGKMGFSMGRAAKGGLMGAAFLALPAIAAEGGPGERVKAGMGGAGNYIGWEVGFKAGAAIGGTIGAYIPVIGATAIGAFAGGIIGGFAGSEVGQAVGEATYGALDAIAARGRKRRTSNWVGDMGAFRTQKAATMRQASLQMMNNGLMTARSALGSEGVMFHQ